MALQLQQEVISTLKKVDGDIRRFAACLDKAKMSKTVEDTDIENSEELQTLNNQLRQHRDEVRKLMTSSGTPTQKKMKKDVNASNASKKLADARQRIEHELRRFQEYESCLATKAISVASPTSTGSETDVSIHDHDAEVKVTVDQVVGSGNNDLIEEFTCKICLVHVVGCEPQLTRCSHLFCGDCMSQWFAMNPGNKTWAQRAKSAGSVPCPVCKEPLHKDQDLNPVSRDGEGGSQMLFRMLSDTKIVCGNNAKCTANGQCDWKGDYGSYQEHIRLCKNLPLFGPSPPPAEEAPVAAALEGVAEVSDTPVEPVQTNTSHREAIEIEETPFEDSALPAEELLVLDSQPQEVDTLAGLIGALLELQPNDENSKVAEDEGEDTCSTDAASQSEQVESGSASSDAESGEVLQAYNAADFQAQASSISPSAKRRQAKRQAAENAKKAQEAKITQAAQAQAQARQWQAAVAHQQAAQCQWQMAAQLQAAQVQAARIVQWQQVKAGYMQQAQLAYAGQVAQVAQMQAQQAMLVQRARAGHKK